MKSILDYIGNTPIVPYQNKERNTKIFLKMESLNPGGSVKDRIALVMINDAEKKKIITSQTVIIEPTSGNTGIGLAMVCAVKKYKLILTMPENMSIERRTILEMYGANVVLTPAHEGMKGAIKKSEMLFNENKNAYMPSQFNNPVNPETHYKTTGPEIWQSLKGKVDVLVAGVGSGGSISGIGKYLKGKNPSVYIVAVEPYDSPVLSGGKAAPHKIQGIGAGFIPQTLNTSIYNEIITVKNDDAFNTANELARCGIFCGISSGANVFASKLIANRPAIKNKNIVTLICDTGERYLSDYMLNKHS